MTSYDIQCPNCRAPQTVSHPGGYEPIYVQCVRCREDFILEPVANGVETYRRGDAPCCSDPDCREIEMGASDND